MIKETVNQASRMDYLAPHFFSTLGEKIATLKAAGVDVIRLDEGAPDLPPAEHIVQALIEGAKSPDRHSYQPHRGPKELRAAWVAMYRRLYQVELDPEREILPLLGSKEGIFHLLQSYIEPGDVVLAPDPGYITYTRGTQFAGGEVFTLPLLPERGYLPDLPSIPGNILQRAKILWLNYPNNPTGATASLEFFQEAVDFARQHGLFVCHDAAYSQVTFDGYKAPSLMQAIGAKEVGLEFNTLSKSHNMAGWRVGAVVGNPNAIQALYTLKTNADSGHFLPIMEASVAAMTGDQAWLEERNQVYQRRRDIMVDGLLTLGFPVARPKASLYVWCPIPQGFTSVDFVSRLIEETGVSLTPGALFGKSGEGYVRISITASEQRIAQAVERIAGFLSNG